METVIVGIGSSYSKTNNIASSEQSAPSAEASCPSSENSYASSLIGSNNLMGENGEYLDFQRIGTAHKYSGMYYHMPDFGSGC